MMNKRFISGAILISGLLFMFLVYVFWQPVLSTIQTLDRTVWSQIYEMVKLLLTVLIIVIYSLLAYTLNKQIQQ